MVDQIVPPLIQPQATNITDLTKYLQYTFATDNGLNTMLTSHKGKDGFMEIHTDRHVTS